MTSNKVAQKFKNELDPSQIQEAEPLTWRFWRKKRYIVVLFGFFGFFNLFSNRVALSVAIIAMSKNCSYIDANNTEQFKAEFNWNSKEKGLVLSSFFYGNIVTQILGGILSQRYGGNLIFGTGVGMSSVLTIFTALAAKHSIWLLITVRLIKGLFQGIAFPSIHAIWTRWSPPMERSRMALIVFSGIYAGMVITQPISALLASHFGWEWIFYTFGAIGCLWYILFTIFVNAGPEVDPWCSKDEVEFIQATLGKKTHVKISHPWKSIITSKPVWAIIVAHFTSNFGFFTWLIELPIYLDTILKFELNEIGFLCAIPYLSIGISMIFSGYLADWTQIKGYLTTTKVRKYFNCFSFLGQSLAFVLVALIIHQVWTVLFITLSVGLGAFAFGGFAVNHLDIAPQHASVLLGISNTFANFPGVIAPLLIGEIVKTGKESEWRTYFVIVVAVYLLGSIVYWFWATGELQEWAKTPEQITQETEK